MKLTLENLGDIEITIVHGSTEKVENNKYDSVARIIIKGRNKR